MAAGKRFGMPTQRMDRRTRGTAGEATTTTRPQRPNDAASEENGAAKGERGHDCSCRRGCLRGFCNRHLPSACQDALAGQPFVAPIKPALHIRPLRG